MDFPSTHWSQLAGATLHGDSVARGALEEFCRRYRVPIAQFIRARGVPAAQVEDLAHDFFLHVMEKSTLRRADASRGRFRSFLLGALMRFLRDVGDRERAAKRGGGAAPLSLDDAGADGAAPAVPPATAAEFDREWAHHVLALALLRLKADYVGRGQATEFAVLRAYVPGGVAPPPYETAAAQLGITLAALKTNVHRLRERFRACLREELATTVASPAEIDAEVTYLGQVLQAQAGSAAPAGS